VEYYGNIQNFQNTILGEQPGSFHENLPQHKLFNCSIDFYKKRINKFSSRSRRKLETSKLSEFNSRGIFGEFSCFLTVKPISSENSIPIDSAQYADNYA
jgi:hypothetical protein